LIFSLLLDRGGAEPPLSERYNMNLLISAIAIFGLGFVANELTEVPTLVIVAVCFALIVGLLVVNNRKGKK
jgi:hypothetical protein